MELFRSNLLRDTYQVTPLSEQAGYNTTCLYFICYKETVQYQNRSWKM